MKVVIVESPAKAKTLKGYLGKDYAILASYGHIRDLPSKDGSVKPDQDFEMSWELSPRATKTLSEIASAAKNATTLYLATDPDREGEAISWHISQVLAAKKVLPKDTHRIVFHEVTKKAILDSINHPRALNQDLVDAYLARRALDYLMGFTLSPILWRKLPGSRSAGRVQSVAVRLVTEREETIEKFIQQEYWSLTADCQNPKGENFEARLSVLSGVKLEKLSISSEKGATEAKKTVESVKPYVVSKIDKSKKQRHPAAPFTTSTLQQEAARKLGLSAARTMRVAQELYEGVSIGGETVGLITYMRTDSVALSEDALQKTRAVITSKYGNSYLPDAPRRYKTKVRNAQEAHEAIRPTDPSLTPDNVKSALSGDLLRLYELIWKRTVSSQMTSAQYDQMSADLLGQDKKTILRAQGSVLLFDGFLKVYVEGRDEESDGYGPTSGKDEDGDSASRKLPPLQEGETILLKTVHTHQHFTQPPPRFTEASLVKKLEELGIGRPSTYAAIMQVIQDRSYVRLEKKQFHPEERGRIVTAFLENYFTQYVQYDFTADLENGLDDISEGHNAWKKLLKEFWDGLKTSADNTKELRISDVLDVLDQKLAHHLFPETEENKGKNPRACPQCTSGKLSLKLGKFGAFIGCSDYPTCRYTRQITPQEKGEGGTAENSNEDNAPKILGTDPITGGTITVRKGPYGPYVQKDPAEGMKPSTTPLEEEPTKGKKTKTKKAAAPKPLRMSIPKGYDPATLTLEEALALLTLPREVGIHPETEAMITASIGRFGPYLKHQDAFVSLKGEDDVLTIGLNRAVTVLADAAEKKKNQPERTRKTRAAPPKKRKTTARGK